MPPKVLYFDLGNVLLYFDHARAARQMAAVAGIDETLAWEVVFSGGLEHRYERGEISRQEFYETFCRLTDSRPNLDELERAASDIFTLNVSILPVVGNLCNAGYRLGILSNTNESHWRFVSQGRYAILLGTFDVLALSYRLKAMKPEPEIFQAAARLAGAQPQEILYVDDLEGHIQAARAAGFDAIRYTGTPELVSELEQRGLRFNY